MKFDTMNPGTIRLPAGEIEVYEPIVLSSGVRIIGDGTLSTVLKKKFDGNLFTTQPPDGDNRARHIEISDLSIHGENTIGDGIHFSDVTDSLISRVFIKNCQNGIALCESFCCILSGNKVQENTWYGLQIIDNSNNNTVQGGRYRANDCSGILVDGPNTYATNLYGVNVESNGMSSPYPGISWGANYGCKGGVIQGCHLEKNKSGADGQIFVGGNSHSVHIAGNWIVGKNGGGENESRYAIRIGHSYGVTMVGNATAGHDFDDCASVYFEQGAKECHWLGGVNGDPVRFAGPGIPDCVLYNSYGYFRGEVFENRTTLP